MDIWFYSKERYTRALFNCRFLMPEILPPTVSKHSLKLNSEAILRHELPEFRVL